MVTLGESEEKRRTAEDILITVWQAGLKMSDDQGDFGVVKEAIDRILETVRRIPDSNIESIERHCISLQIRCCSWSGILSTVEYFDSADFRTHLWNVSIELSLIYNIPLATQGHLTIECLSGVIEKLKTDFDQEPRLSYLSVPIRCSSAEGMRNVLTVLKEETTNNNVNIISDSLSFHCGGRISLEMHTDIKEFTDTGIFYQTASTGDSMNITMPPKSFKHPSVDSERHQTSVDGRQSSSDSQTNSDEDNEAELKEELKRSKEKVSELHKEILRLKSKLKELQKQFAGSEESVRKLNEEIEQKDKDNNALEKEVSRLENELIESRGDSKKIFDQLEETKNAIIEQTKEVKRLHESVQSKDTELHEMHETVKRLAEGQVENQREIRRMSDTLENIGNFMKQLSGPPKSPTDPSNQSPRPGNFLPDIKNATQAKGGCPTSQETRSKTKQPWKLGVKPKFK